MRVDQAVYFVTAGDRFFNPETGDYEVSEGDKAERYAYVTDTGTERMNALYGGIKHYAKTIRLNEVYEGKFDHIEIDDRRYQLDMRRTYRHKTVLEVSGV